MRDEDRFPTMRFLTCPACGQAYTASLSGVDTCPGCGTPARPGSAASAQVQRTRQGSHVLLTVKGPRYKLQEVEDLRFEIDRALKEDPDSIAFHFHGASFLDSSMLGQIVRTLQEMTLRGKSIFVITDDPQVLESLQILDLDRVLTILPGLEAYRAGLA